MQISAAILGWHHRLLRAPMRASMVIAGGAAGVAAAFNTPLAGVTFAIEELADAYEQRVALLVMTTILIAGIVSLGLSGDYVYFGAVGEHLDMWRRAPHRAGRRDSWRPDRRPVRTRPARRRRRRAIAGCRC